MSNRTEKIQQLKKVLSPEGPAKRMPGAEGEDVTAQSLGIDDLTTGPKLDALLEAGFLAAAADGVLSQREVDQLSAGMSDLIEGRASPAAVEALLSRCTDALLREGLPARAAHLAQVLDDADARRGALVMAAGIALIDQGLHARERATLRTLADAFGTSTEELDALIREVEQALTDANLL